MGYSVIECDASREKLEMLNVDAVLLNARDCRNGRDIYRMFMRKR